MKALFSPIAAALLGVLLMATPASAAEPGGVSQQDREYLNRAHQDNLFEIVSGNLVNRGSCLRVRELGPRFVAHHTALDTELAAVATRNGVPLYSAPDSAQLSRIADEAFRIGPDFDAAWLRDQIAAHRQGIAVAEWETQYGWSPDVKELAARSAPVLREHLDEATAAAGTCPSA
jgi:putative membrane protein